MKKSVFLVYLGVFCSSVGIGALGVFANNSSSSTVPSNVSGLSATLNRDDWQSGYCDKIQIKNTTSAKSQAWKLSFGINGNIGNGWSGNFSKNNSTYTVTPMDWNREIWGYSSTEVGFCVYNSTERATGYILTPLGSSVTNPLTCTETTWTPSNADICSTNSITQTSNCNTTRTVQGTKNCNTQPPVCTESSWLPLASEVCSGTNFVQTSNCNTKRVTTGTKSCTTPPPPTNSFTGTYTPPFSVLGNKVVDSRGVEVVLRGLNWFGFETQDGIVHGLWSNSYKNQIQLMKSAGFNAVRLPFCPNILKGSKPNSIDYSKNPTLFGKTSLEAYDIIIGELANNGMYILLDHHRPDCNTISETPAVAGYGIDQWIADLVTITKRYKNQKNVIGIDLKNEPHGQARWGNGDINTDWKIQVEKAGKSILANNPNLLIFVEGIETNGGTCESNYAHFWGGNIEPINCKPINTNSIPKNKLVLSPHIYGPSVYEQPYLRDPNFPRNLSAIYDLQFGNLSAKYPIIIGEWGGRYEGNDKIWQDALVDYLIKKKIKSSFYWSWNPNSGDTGGIIMDDWNTINQSKLSNIKRSWQ